MNPRKIQAIARKEIYHLIRDARSLYLAFAIPLLFVIGQVRRAGQVHDMRPVIFRLFERVGLAGPVGRLFVDQCPHRPCLYVFTSQFFDHLIACYCSIPQQEGEENND